MSRYQPSPTFITELDGEMGWLFAQYAQNALGHARSIARSLGGTGEYEDSLAAEGRRLLTDDRAGHIIEWGSINNPPYAPLRRAVEATGAKFVDDGRDR